MSDDLKDAILAAFGDDDSKKPEEQQMPEEQPAEGAATEDAPAGAAPAAGAGKPGLGRGAGRGGGGRPVGGRMGAGSGGRVAATQASRAPVLSQDASATTARSAAREPGLASATSSVRPAMAPVAAAPLVASPRPSRNTPLLILVLVLNVALLVLCGGMLAKVSSLSSRIVAMQTQLAQIRQSAEYSSKVHAGVSYLGPNKRPQKYIMVLKYDEKGPKFDQEVFRPLEE